MGDTHVNEESVWEAIASSVDARVLSWEEGARSAAAARAGVPSAEVKAEGSLLSSLHRDPEALDFTRRLIDALFSQTDAFTSAEGLREVTRSELPEHMPTHERLLLKAGGAVSLGLPWLVRPAARKRVLQTLPDVLLQVRTGGRMTALTEELRGMREVGFGALIALTGDPVFGPQGAAAELERLIALAKLPGVHALAFDPARIVPGATEWSIEADVALAAERVAPLFFAALEHRVRLIVEPRDAVWAQHGVGFLRRALGCAELDRLEVGLALSAEIPESWREYADLHRFASRRVADGGAPVEVIIRSGDNAAAERVKAIRTGLPVAVIEDRGERAAQFLRLAELALHPSRAAVLRPVVASEDPLVLATMVEVAAKLGSERLFALQLRRGIATALAEQLVATHAAPEVRLRVPLAERGEFGEALDYLIGLMVDAAGPDPIRPGAPEIDAIVQRAAEPATESHRRQRRDREWEPSERDTALFYRAPDEPATLDTGGLTAAVLGLARGETGELELTQLAPQRELPFASDTGFANEPPTDGGVSANREWARGLLRNATELVVEGDKLDETIALSQADLDPDAAAQAARNAAERWATLSHDGRARRLRRVALASAAGRDRLVTELARETGAPFDELDLGVNHIIDAARYAGHLADGLRAVRGATLVADRLVLVVADARAPLAPQAAAVLGVLGSGAGVLWAVSPGNMRAATACLEEWEAGELTPGAVRIVSVVGEHTFAALGASTAVDRAIVLGDRALGRELARRRPDLRVEGHFAALGSIIVTPSAERERAIADLIDSAFRGHQTSQSRARRVILLGGLGRSREFRSALQDAVRALRVGDVRRPGTRDPLAFDIGPLRTPPTPAELAALTTLGSGEEWLVQPEQLDEDGLLWSPGVRLGVDPGSPFWDDARDLPVLGVTTAALFSDAVAQQNSFGSGAIAGLQSWDEREVLTWLDRAEAAELFVNRATSGALISRQPSGGWNEAVMGLPALTGGPHWLVPQGSWERRTGSRSDTLHLRGLNPEIVLLIEASQPELSYEEFDELRRAALADQLAWQTGLGRTLDTSQLGIERNALRAEPVATHVRLGQHGTIAELVRVLAAALLVRAPIEVSTGTVLPPALLNVLEAQGIEVSLERDPDWLERLAVTGPTVGSGVPAARIRLVGGDRVRTAEWLGGLDRVGLWAEPVTMAGPVELLVFAREQSVSVRAERHGLAVPAPGIDALLD